MENQQTLPKSLELLIGHLEKYSEKTQVKYYAYISKDLMNRPIVVIDEPVKFIEYLTYERQLDSEESGHSVKLLNGMGYTVAIDGESHVYVLTLKNVSTRLLGKYNKINYEADESNDINLSPLYNRLEELDEMQDARDPFDINYLKPGFKNYDRFVCDRHSADNGRMMPSIFLVATPRGTNKELTKLAAKLIQFYRLTHNLVELPELTSETIEEIMGVNYTYLRNEESPVFEIEDGVILWNGAHLLTERGFVTRDKKHKVSSVILAVPCKNGSRYSVAICYIDKQVTINIFELAGGGQGTRQCDALAAIIKDLSGL